MASNEDRVGKFLRRLLQSRSALDIMQKLARGENAAPHSAPGGSSVSSASVEHRWKLLNVSEDARRALYDPSVSLEPYSRNKENCISTFQIPVGLAGPLRVRGMFATGDFYVPLATTGAALVASYSRGEQAITEAGGCVSILLHEEMRRSPGFRFKSLIEAGLFSIWCMETRDALHASAGATTRHGELTDLDIAIEGNHVYLILEFVTGDASGQNMVTIATQAICEYIVANFSSTPRYHFVEANFSGDKKATAHSFVTVRGKKVSAEVTLPAALVRSRLHTTPRQWEQYWKMSAIGAIQSGSNGIQAHYANALAAFHIACGQDPACVAESAVAVTRLEVTDEGDLYAAVTLPIIVFGSVGGGTSLPGQHARLELLGMAGKAKAKALAELRGALALACELSITGALCAGEFTRAHQRLARGRKASSKESHG